MKVKQVIVMRSDLKMRRGKEIAQGSHASMAFITRRMVASKKWLLCCIQYIFRCVGLHVVPVSNVEQWWLDSSFAKVVCRVYSEKELLELYEKAKQAGLEVHLVTDSGRTEFKGQPTNTCLAIGPDYAEDIDPITGELDLY